MKPKIDEMYIQTGKVRFEWHHYLLTRGAHRPHQASVCAREQGAFWPYHDYLYEHQQELASTGYGEGTLVEVAAEVGLDTGQFFDCLLEERYADVVEADFDYAREQGVGFTPTFFVNDVRLIGVQPFEVFADIIDALLADLEE